MSKQRLVSILFVFCGLLAAWVSVEYAQGQTVEQMAELAKHRGGGQSIGHVRSQANRYTAVEPNYADPNYLDVNDINDLDISYDELSRIELLLSGRAPNNVSVNLKQYGYDVFRRKVTTFAPVTNIPVGPDYTVGPGDRFTITIWGRHNDQLSVPVGRDGSIVLPEVGKLSVAGLPFGKLQEYIESELKRKYTDFKLHINMERLRTITVYVVGEAKTPSSYTISALSTAVHALFAAGGPTKNGSLRKIHVIRSGQTVKTVDMYDILMFGNMQNDIRLVDGDMLHVPLIGDVVGVAGNVKRPAIYELKEKTSLGEVLNLAGGVTHAGWLQHVQIDRIEAHQQRTVVDFDLSAQAATEESALLTALQDGDLVKIYPVLEREEGVVFLDGHVVRPGKFQLRSGMRIRDILKDHRLLQPHVNLEYAQIERLVPPDMHQIVIPFHLGRLLTDDPAENKELQNLDTIRLYQWDQMRKRSVTISGLVYEPNEYPLVPGMRVKDLIDAAGGLQKNAYLEQAEVTRHHIKQTGVTTEEVEINLARAIEYDTSHNILLKDHDHIVIRPIPELEMDNVVEITGEVRFPGTYPISKGERLSSVIARAGGFTNEAYLKGAVFTRESARAIQNQRLQEMVQQLEESMLTEASEGVSKSADAEAAEMQQAALEAKQRLIQKLGEVQASGRVVIKLLENGHFKGSQYDLLLEDQDQLEIPKTPGIVSIVGEVFNQTSLLFEEDLTVEYYINRVGGLKKDADKKQISVIKADGSVISMAQKSRSALKWNSVTRQWESGSFMKTRLEPGDTIVVPKKLDRIFWLKNTKDITQIIFQMALAVGVVLAL